MQYAMAFKGSKMIILDNKLYLLIFAQTIDCGYTLEQPLLGSSNEYLQFMF